MENKERTKECSENPCSAKFITIRSDFSDPRSYTFTELNQKSDCSVDERRENIHQRIAQRKGERTDKIRNKLREATLGTQVLDRSSPPSKNPKILLHSEGHLTFPAHHQQRGREASYEKPHPLPLLSLRAAGLTLLIRSIIGSMFFF